MTPMSSLLRYMDELKQWILSWKILNGKGKVVNNNFRLLDGWFINIAAVKLLKELCEKKSFSYLCTNRLRTDPLENVFAITRGRGGFDQYLSCLSFCHSFKQVMTN